MKVVIFCGGLGTRFNNGSPGPLKPLIIINGKTILERIMDLYKNLSNVEFILLGGYKFIELKKFCKNFKKYKVIAVNTGRLTPTGGRLLKIKEIIGSEKFFLTYGDSLINYNPVKSIINNKKFIINVYNYKIPYGVVYLDTKKRYIKKFLEKKFEVFINAGFFYLDSSIFNYIFSFKESFEQHVLPRIIKNKKENNKIFYIKTNAWFPIDNKYDLDNILKSKLIK